MGRSLSPLHDAPRCRRVAEASVAEAAEAALDWLRTGDVEKCMTRFHSRWNEGQARAEARTQEEEA